MIPPLPQDEPKRLETLRQYQILDTPSENLFDDLTQLASGVCEAPIAVIVFIDDHRQWFKSKIGVSPTETPRESAICAHAILQRQPLIIHDTASDPRVSDNPWVISDPHVRFYAGAPLLTPEGHALGTVCVMDYAPRELRPQQIEGLQTIAHETMMLLDLRRQLSALSRMVTGLRQAEEALQMYQFSLEHAPEGVFFMTRDAGFSYVNEQACRSLGYTRDELMRLKLWDIDPIYPKENWEKTWTQRQEEQIVTVHVETLHRRKDGVVFPVEVSAKHLWFGDHEFHVAFVRDITERKKAEEAIAAERERLSVTLRSIGDGVITTDVDEKIVLMNNVAEVLTGWTQEEAIGRPLHQIFHIINEKTRARCENPVEKVLQTGVVVGLANHTVLISKDGTERIIADTGAPIRDKAGHVLGVVLVFRDITQKQKMEEDLLRAGKLEAVGLLAGGIAHDFNNILAAILGNLSLMMMSTDPKDPFYRRLSDAERASLRARDLAQQLLTFAKGGAPVKKTVFMKELLEESIRFALSGSNVGAEFFFSDDLWPVEIDEGQITQVVHNLVINAQQAMPEGGIIQVRAENYLAAEREKRLPLPQGRYVQISIRDFGIGIPKEHLPRIFDPYFTTKQKGSGLGLTTSYSIIKKHDGYMTADSELGKGSTFSIYLAASSHDVEPERRSEAPLRGAGKILIMDDERAVREVAGELLGFLGYRVGHAEDGAEMIARYREASASGEPFDLVIMDLTVPGKMGGKEAIQRLLEIDPHVKAIVSSGYSNDPIMGDYARYGFKGVIAKPYQLQELSKTVHDVITGSPGET